MYWQIFICLATGYLLGSLNGGLAISKWSLHSDIRKSGSGSAGFTNAKRVYGMKLAGAVWLIDMAKTVLACCVGRLIMPDSPMIGGMLAGIGAAIGHIYPIFFGFRGGKGFTCAMATVLVADYRIALIGLAVLIAVALTMHYMSVGSLTASVSNFIGFCLFYPDNHDVWILAAIIMLIVFLAHISNIKRLLNGNENRTHFGKSHKKPGVKLKPLGK